MGNSCLLTDCGLFTFGWSLLLTANSVVPFLLTVEIRFGLFVYSAKLDLVFFCHCSPCPEIGFGLFYLQFPLCK